MKKSYFRLLKIFLSLTLTGTGAGLFFSVFKENMIFYYTLQDISKDLLLNNRLIRIGARVQKGSHTISSTGSGTFVLEEGPTTLVVRYTTPLPTLFQEGRMVVVQGKLISLELLQAEEVLAKHDEWYTPLPKECHERSLKR